MYLWKKFLKPYGKNRWYGYSEPRPVKKIDVLIYIYIYKIDLKWVTMAYNQAGGKKKSSIYILGMDIYVMHTRASVHVQLIFKERFRNFLNEFNSDFFYWKGFCSHLSFDIFQILAVFCWKVLCRIWLIEKVCFYIYVIINVYRCSWHELKLYVKAWAL